MKWKTLATGLATCLMLSGMARADWDPTKWGMSLDEVRRVVPAASTSPLSDIFRTPGYGDDKNQANSFLYTRIERDNRIYDVRMGFADGKLKSVEFGMINASAALCTTARNNLQRRFGTPVGGGEGEGGRFDSWNAPADQVVFIYRTEPVPRCVILYAPRKPAGTDSQLPARNMVVTQANLLTAVGND